MIPLVVVGFLFCCLVAWLLWLEISHPTAAIRRMLGKKWRGSDSCVDVKTLGRTFRFRLVLDQDATVRGVLNERGERVTENQRKAWELPSEKDKDVTSKLGDLDVCGVKPKKVRLIHRDRRNAYYQVITATDFLHTYVEETDWSGALFSRLT